VSSRPDDADKRDRQRVLTRLGALEKWCSRLASVPSTTLAQRQAVLKLREAVLECRQAFLEPRKGKNGPRAAADQGEDRGVS
jgi:hypothetical protein